MRKLGDKISIILRLISRDLNYPTLYKRKINCLFNTKYEKEEIDIGNKDDVNKKLMLLKIEHQYFLEKNMRVPTTISDTEWQVLLKMISSRERQCYFNYLYNNELHINKAKRKHEKHKVERQISLEIKNENSHIKYGLFCNSILYYISETQMTLAYNWYQANAVMFGQILIIDLGYDQHMTQQEINSSAKQIALVYAMNKISKQPWNLYFCNAKSDDPLLKAIKLVIPNLQTPTCLITVTEKSYLEFFSKEKLVYLCAESAAVLKTFNHESIYIVRGFVDLKYQKPITLGKIRRERVCSVQLPLSKYFGHRPLNLTINQEAGILFDLKLTGEWKTALKHIPARKIRQGMNYYSFNK